MAHWFVHAVRMSIVGSGALISAAAPAQVFAYYGEPQIYGGYQDPAYYGERAYDVRREAWLRHERWEREEARSRYWARERAEHARAWRGDDDDDRW